MPYMMLREAEFFKDTVCLIDLLHDKNHSKCSTACMLKSYKHSIEWRRINGSAAECGNAGLSRIRKSCSYSSQRTVTILVSKFIDIWNRIRIREQQGLK